MRPLTSSLSHQVTLEGLPEIDDKEAQRRRAEEGSTICSRPSSPGSKRSSSASSESSMTRTLSDVMDIKRFSPGSRQTGGTPPSSRLATKESAELSDQPDTGLFYASEPFELFVANRRVGSKRLTQTLTKINSLPTLSREGDFSRRASKVSQVSFFSGLQPDAGLLFDSEPSELFVANRRVGSKRLTQPLPLNMTRIDSEPSASNERNLSFSRRAGDVSPLSSDQPDAGLLYASELSGLFLARRRGSRRRHTETGLPQMRAEVEEPRTVT